MNDIVTQIESGLKGAKQFYLATDGSILGINSNPTCWLVYDSIFVKLHRDQIVEAYDDLRNRESKLVLEVEWKEENPTISIIDKYHDEKINLGTMPIVISPVWQKFVVENNNFQLLFETSIDNPLGQEPFCFSIRLSGWRFINQPKN